MNTTLLLKIKEQILAEPRQFNMDYWFVSDRTIPNCHTAACIAGWAITLGKNYHDPLESARSVKEEFNVYNSYLFGESAALIRPLAIEALDITYDQADNLFDVDGWPDDFRYAYRVAEAEKPEAMAKIAADRIDHFIATNGEE